MRPGVDLLVFRRAIQKATDGYLASLASRDKYRSLFLVISQSVVTS